MLPLCESNNKIQFYNYVVSTLVAVYTMYVIGIVGIREFGIKKKKKNNFNGLYVQSFARLRYCFRFTLQFYYPSSLTIFFSDLGFNASISPVNNIIGLLVCSSGPSKSRRRTDIIMLNISVDVIVFLLRSARTWFADVEFFTQQVNIYLCKC